MAKTFEEKLAALPMERRKKIEKRTAELLTQVRAQQANQRSRNASAPAHSNKLTQAPDHG